MPFEIVRNDIVNMQTDAIVNTSSVEPCIGSGVDTAIHKKAGEALALARKAIGRIDLGGAAITPAYGLDAKYVIHVAGPVWQGGDHNEAALLAACYKNALELARKHKCKSISFPLISTGNYGYPKADAMQIAINEFSTFLTKYDMQIYLVVFGKDALMLSEKLFASVKSYIDENYIQEKTAEEYSDDMWSLQDNRNRRYDVRHYSVTHYDSAPTPPDYAEINDDRAIMPMCNVAPPAVMPCAEPILAKGAGLDDVLSKLDAGFSETLLKLIDKSGKKDSDIYKKANIDRKLFSKIRNNRNYKPSKATAVAFALALELNLDDAKDFLARAGYALSHSSKFDVIVEYYIVNKNYDVFELNEVLFTFDQPLLGA